MQPTQHIKQRVNGPHIASAVRENDSNSDVLLYGKDKYDREDLHTAYMFLCEPRLQNVKEINANWGIPQSCMPFARVGDCFVVLIVRSVE